MCHGIVPSCPLCHHRAINLTKMLLRVGLRKFTTATAVRSMDWVSLSQKVTTDATKAEINRLRDLHGDLTSYANGISEKPEPIDFSHYRNTIKTAGLVDAIESDYNKVSLPKFNNPVEAEAEDK